jgi:hypothetical protein
VGWTTSAAFFMGLWACLVGLHAFWVIYVELRERLVRKAIERERRYYQIGDSFQKPKRRAAAPRLRDDGELVDYPASEADDLEDEVEVRVKRER